MEVSPESLGCMCRAFPGNCRWREFQGCKYRAFPECLECSRFRSWLKQGLAAIDDRRPILILGLVGVAVALARRRSDVVLLGVWAVILVAFSNPHWLPLPNSG